jgi:hypothetical protein
MKSLIRTEALTALRPEGLLRFCTRVFVLIKQQHIVSLDLSTCGHDAVRPYSSVKDGERVLISYMCVILPGRNVFNLPREMFASFFFFFFFIYLFF